MIKINVVDRTGENHEVEVEAGQPLMGFLIGQPWGVEALCGGCCSCATCHVYVPDEFAALAPEAADDEDEILSYEDTRKPNSRLSCQIECVDDMEGMTFTIAPSSL